MSLPKATMTYEEKVQAAVQFIVRNVTYMHDITGREFKPGRRNAWSAEAGQWIVYGLERQLGFDRSVQLCAVVERAWRAGGDVPAAVTGFIQEINPRKSAASGG